MKLIWEFIHKVSANRHSELNLKKRTKFYYSGRRLNQYNTMIPDMLFLNYKFTSKQI